MTIDYNQAPLEFTTERVIDTGAVEREISGGLEEGVIAKGHTPVERELFGGQRESEVPGCTDGEEPQTRQSAAVPPAFLQPVF